VTDEEGRLLGCSAVKLGKTMALMMEELTTSNSRSLSARLHGVTAQETAVFKQIN
jgi:hypothetical protein